AISRQLSAASYKLIASLTLAEQALDFFLVVLGGHAHVPRLEVNTLALAHHLAVRLEVHGFATAGYLEPLGGALMGLHLRHGRISVPIIMKARGVAPRDVITHTSGCVPPFERIANAPALAQGYYAPTCPRPRRHSRLPPSVFRLPSSACRLSPVAYAPRYPRPRPMA